MCISLQPIALEPLAQRARNVAAREVGEDRLLLRRRGLERLREVSLPRHPLHEFLPELLLVTDEELLRRELALSLVIPVSLLRLWRLLSVPVASFRDRRGEEKRCDLAEPGR